MQRNLRNRSHCLHFSVSRCYSNCISSERTQLNPAHWRDVPVTPGPPTAPGSAFPSDSLFFRRGYTSELPQGENCSTMNFCPLSVSLYVCPKLIVSSSVTPRLTTCSRCPSFTHQSHPAMNLRAARESYSCFDQEAQILQRERSQLCEHKHQFWQSTIQQWIFTT